MKVFIVAVRDRQAGVFHAPGVAISHGAAIRSFGDMVNDDNHPYAKHPDDYDLYELGTFDDNTGKIVPTDPVELFLGKNVAKVSK